MTRAEMSALFLATLDELAVCPYYDGAGTPEKPRLGGDTIINILLDEIDEWTEVPYRAIRAMFAALLAHLPADDVERMLACISVELKCSEEYTAQAEIEAREDQAINLAHEAVDRVQSDPELMKLWAGFVPRVVQARLEDAAKAGGAS
jgi:hypothetical protein